MTSGTKALVVTSIGVSMSALDTTIVNVARDTIGRSFNASESAVSWVLSGYSIVFAAVLLTAGRIADRYGRKKIYTIGLLAFITASGLCALAPTLPILIAARSLQAVGGALLSPAALALVLPEFPLEKRSAAIAVWGAIGSIGAGAGPVLGSLLLRAFGWRSAFFINLPVGLVAFVLGRKLLHESKDEEAKGIPDPVSIVAGVGSVGILALAITKGNEWGYLSPRSTICFVAAAALLPLFIWRCRTARLPVLDLRLLKQRAFAVGNVSVLFFGLPFYGQLVGNITFLQRTWHYSPLGRDWRVCRHHLSPSSRHALLVDGAIESDTVWSPYPEPSSLRCHCSCTPPSIRSRRPTGAPMDRSACSPVSASAFSSARSSHRLASICRGIVSPWARHSSPPSANWDRPLLSPSRWPS